MILTSIVSTTISAQEMTVSEAVTCRYRTHVQNVGWQEWKSDGVISGTSGQGLRLEGIEIETNVDSADLGIEYQTHVQNIGWQGYKRNGEMSGTSGLSYRLEAIQVRLTGTDKELFDVYYRVHAENYGWLDWAKNGNEAGTEGLGLRLEAINIQIVPIGSKAPGETGVPYISKTVFLNNIKGEWNNEGYSISGPHLKIREENADSGLLWLGSKWYENRYRVTAISRDGKSGTLEAYEWNYYKYDTTLGKFIKIETDVFPSDKYVYTSENDKITKYTYVGNNVRVETFSR